MKGSAIVGYDGTWNDLKIVALAYKDVNATHSRNTQRFGCLEWIRIDERYPDLPESFPPGKIPNPDHNRSSFLHPRNFSPVTS